MRSFIHAVLTATLAASLAGCAEPDPTGILDLDDEPTLETRGGKGSGGTNGLSDIEHAAFSARLATAARLFPLVDQDTNDVSAGVRAHLELTTSLAGQRVFGYAMQCVLPETETVRVGMKLYHGLGHLPEGARWLAGPLAERDIQDLLACMALHVNPGGYTVSILLLGSSVKDDPNAPDLPVQEALWRAHVGVDDVPSYVVWPFETVQKVCSSNLEEALKYRVCGKAPGECNLRMGDIHDCYRDENGDHFCLGEPVIETRLKESDVPYLYDLCL